MLQRIDTIFCQHHLVTFARQQPLRHTTHRERIVDYHHNMMGAQTLYRFRFWTGRFRCRHLGNSAHLMRRIGCPHARRTYVLMRGALCQRHRIEDQHDIARTQHGSAGNTRHARQLRADILDHDLAVALHFVDVNRNTVITALQDHNR